MSGIRQDLLGIARPVQRCQRQLEFLTPGELRSPGHSGATVPVFHRLPRPIARSARVYLLRGQSRTARCPPSRPPPPIDASSRRMSTESRTTPRRAAAERTAGRRTEAVPTVPLGIDVSEPRALRLPRAIRTTALQPC